MVLFFFVVEEVTSELMVAESVATTPMEVVEEDEELGRMIDNMLEPNVELEGAASMGPLFGELGFYGDQFVGFDCGFGGFDFNQL